MHSNQSNDEHILQLKQQIHSLQQQIQQLNSYINYSNVYEYYIQGVKLEKVKGTFQLGQLTQNELADSDGIHRFYIGEIIIKEIEDTGTVGLGITEKRKESQNKEIPSEHATGEIKAMYNGINTLLAIENTPSFFQSLSVHEQILIKVWEFMNEQWKSTDEFTTFYENTLKLLNESINPRINITKPNFEDEVYISLADYIEEQAKTLLVIGCLLESNFPNYLSKYKSKMTKIKSKLTAAINETQSNIATIQTIVDTIKSTFDLDTLPSSFEELVEQPDTLRHFYYHLLHQVMENGDAVEFLDNLYELILDNTCNITNELNLNELTPEEQGYLFATLLESLNQYPIFILLEYLQLQL
ncbi:hypothetical protein [Litchfieldia salsa]|uniref:Uncharacterized protein n=1 Tax=Litchfieldia salsa TaxID=930152 RepID=A0A1H0Q5D2_9BACI|nr:hypothetical protein [Litchfieldia salsa]SDP12621.1 hypothetical protein SAMN05216565_101612 [Litchfieldia salsa]